MNMRDDGFFLGFEYPLQANYPMFCLVKKKHPNWWALIKVMWIVCRLDGYVDEVRAQKMFCEKYGCWTRKRYLW